MCHSGLALSNLGEGDSFLCEETESELESESESESELKEVSDSLSEEILMSLLGGVQNAFLVFETRSINGTSKEEIGGSLSIAIEKLGPISASGSGSFELTDEVKEVTKSLKFTFHGDGIIKPPPKTYEEAIAVYNSLPDMSQKYERVVSFSIAPLSEYCGLAGKT